ncbi:MAG: hypothetical protein ISQ09_11310 [Rubripirellula sp.]|nr:hypothetical protein [Rubripirellula sp.]
MKKVLDGEDSKTTKGYDRFLYRSSLGPTSGTSKQQERSLLQAEVCFYRRIPILCFGQALAARCFPASQPNSLASQRSRETGSRSTIA